MGQVTDRSGRLAGLLIVGVGILFLLAQFGVFSFSLVGILWPFFIIGPGAIFLYIAMTGSEETAPLVIPGAIITGTGGILLLQSITGRWESWAYMWTLYPVFLGMGLVYMGRRTSNAGTFRTGREFARWGLVAFVVFAAFFELFIFSGSGLAGMFWPGLLILAGLWLLFRSRTDHAPRKRKVDDDPLFTGAPAGSRRRRVHPGDELRRKIDLALAEDDMTYDEEAELIDEPMEPEDA